LGDAEAMQRYLPYDPTLWMRVLMAIGPLWRWCARRFQDAFSPGEPYPPHPSAMLDEPNAAYNLVFPRFFRRISVDEEGVERIRQTALSATVVYVTKYVGQLEYNYFNHLFTEKGLPKSVYCNALTLLRWMRSRRLWRTIARTEEEIARHGRPLDPLVDGQMTGMIASGQSVMLRIPQADLEEEHIVYSNPLKGLGMVVEAQRRSERPIVIVPVDFLWSRRPPKANRSMADILFGETEQPGRLRKFVLFWRNYKRRAQATLGAPLDVKRLVEDNPGAGNEVLAQALRQTLKSTLRLQRRAITGPPIRPRSSIIQEILADEALDGTICRIAADRRKDADDLRELAHRYAKEIVADLDYTYVEFLERLMGSTLVRLFDSFNVDTDGLARAKELFGRGPVVLVPNHKSHADYLLLSFVLYHHGMNVPHIAAGKNLSFWPLGRIFRRCGAFFIRRSFRGNDLYEAVLQTYLKVLLKEGHSLEFFIEGGRSRTGKLRTPRTGMLRMLTRAAREGEVREMHYIPVAITYDRVIEQGSYERELAGGHKEEERPSHLLKLTKFMGGQKSTYGSIYIRFGEPIPGDAAHDDAATMEKLAQDICHEINRNIVVTPTAVAATALLSSHSKGMAFPAFRKGVEAVLACLAAKGVEVPPKLAKSPHAVLQDAVVKLAALKLVTTREDALEPFITVDESKRVPLSYIRNGIGHFLVSTGVVARLIRRHLSKGKAPSVEELAEDLGGAKKLLFREYRFATNRPLAEHARKVVDFLASQDALSISPEGRIIGNEQGSATFRIFEAQVLPSIERIWIASRVVAERMKAPLEERALIKEMMLSGEDMYLLGKLEFRESMTKDGFRSAIETLRDFGLIAIQEQKAGAKQKRFYEPTGDGRAQSRLKAELEKLI